MNGDWEVGCSIKARFESITALFVLYFTLVLYYCRRNSFIFLKKTKSQRRSFFCWNRFDWLIILQYCLGSVEFCWFGEMLIFIIKNVCHLLNVSKEIIAALYKLFETLLTTAVSSCFYTGDNPVRRIGCRRSFWRFRFLLWVSQSPNKNTAFTTRFLRLSNCTNTVRSILSTKII